MLESYFLALEAYECTDATDVYAPASYDDGWQWQEDSWDASGADAAAWGAADWWQDDTPSASTDAEAAWIAAAQGNEEWEAPDWSPTEAAAQVWIACATAPHEDVRDLAPPVFEVVDDSVQYEIVDHDDAVAVGGDSVGGVSVDL